MTVVFPVLFVFVWEKYNGSLSLRIPAKVLKPGDWERGNRGRGNWRPQLGFNSNRQQVHLDQSAFRALGYVHISSD